jgi:3-oxoacyl-[acyl-carrier-protein] synthase-3
MKRNYLYIAILLVLSACSENSTLDMKGMFSPNGETVNTRFEQSMAYNKSRGEISLDMGADGTGGRHLIQPGGGSRNPATHATVDAHDHTIHMDGQDVFKFAARKMPAACKKVLEKAGMTIDDIALLVPHQANMRIIDNAISRLKIDRDKVWINIDKHGNMSAACIPVCLTEARQAGKLKKGDNVIMVAFGAGLTWAGALVKWAK